MSQAHLEMDSLADYESHGGQVLEPSPWVTIDQKMIDAFGEATGDRNWYHMDVERAARELPGGRTIAHAPLTLSLVPHMASQIVSVRRLPGGCIGTRCRSRPACACRGVKWSWVFAYPECRSAHWH